MKNSRCALIIPDLHCPFNHADSFEFIKAVYEVYKPDHIIFTGDEVDKHNLSYHDSDPDIPFTASGELERAIESLKPFYKLFPKAVILESNHGSLVYRKAKTHGIPRHYLRSYREVLEAPKGWKWEFSHEFKSGGKEIYCHHGQSKNVLRNTQNHSMCYIQGHHHGTFDIQYWANTKDIFWGMTAGCLVDHKSLAMAYGKNHLSKPILGCGLVIEGCPVLIPMILNKHGRWIGDV